MLNRNESIVYSNDFSEDAKEEAKYAIQSPDTLSDMLTRDDGDSNRIEGFFETLGMSEEEAADLTGYIVLHLNEDAAEQEIFKEFERLAPDNASKQKAIQYLADDMIQSGYYQETMEDYLKQQIEENCDALGLPPHDDILILGSDEANPKVLSPEKNMADEILWSLPYADPVMTIKHEGQKPCLKAEISSPDVKGTIEYTIIPSEWAEDAYLSKEFHNKLNKLLLEHDDVKDFLYDAKAIQTIAQAPVSAAITNGAIELMREEDSFPGIDAIPNTKPPIDRVARKLQNFDKDAFDAWLDERLDEHPSFTETPYDASRSLELDIPDYLKSLPETKATDLSRGITNIFASKDYDKIQKAISGIVYGEKKTIQHIKEAGKVAER